MRSFLYGVGPHDVMSIAASVTVLAMSALLAGYVPASRASRIDPLTAIRDE